MKSQATKNQEPQSLALSLFLSLLNNLLTTTSTTCETMISSNPSTQWFNTRNMPKVPCWWCHFDCLPAWVFVAAAWLLAWAIVSARRRKARPVAWYRWVLHSEWRPFFFGGGGTKMAGPKVSFCVCHSFLWPRTGSVEVLKCFVFWVFRRIFGRYHLPSFRHGSHRPSPGPLEWLLFGSRFADGPTNLWRPTRLTMGSYQRGGDPPWYVTLMRNKLKKVKNSTPQFSLFSAVIVDRRVFWKGGWVF